jgi:hypothetical protein
MFFLIFLEFFIAFPERKDAITSKHSKSGSVNVEASGSLGLYYSQKCHKTHPNETIVENKEFDWCSNVADPKKGENPWIMYSLKGKTMKLTGYAIRNGCCYHSCCCDEGGKVVDYGCCCSLYSFSLYGSSNKETWKLLHRVEKETNFWGCKFMTFDIANSKGSFTYIKLVEDEQYPNCPFCMQINQVEFYGEALKSFSPERKEEDEESDESVSIIGKVKRNNDE